MSNLIANNLKKNFGKKTIFENISLNLSSDEITCIVGKNGVGKSTLLKGLAGELKLDNGNVSIDDSNTIDEMQDIILIKDHSFMPKACSIETIIAMFEKRNDKFDRNYVVDYLDFFNISISTVFGSLSKGNQEIVQQALLIANCPKFVLFDEPFAAVDITKRDFLYDKLIDLNADGVGVVITTHIVSEIQDIFSRIIILNEDGSIKSITVDEIFELGFDNINDYIKQNI